MACVRNSALFLVAGLTLYGAPSFAAPQHETGTAALLQLGTPMPTAQLRAARARGEIIVSAANAGTVSNNSVGAGSLTGSITDNQSVQNNSGFTTVMQNTGNNALLQNSTSVYVSLK